MVRIFVLTLINFFTLTKIKAFNFPKFNVDFKCVVKNFKIRNKKNSFSLFSKKIDFNNSRIKFLNSEIVFNLFSTFFKIIIDNLEISYKFKDNFQAPDNHSVTISSINILNLEQSINLNFKGIFFKHINGTISSGNINLISGQFFNYKVKTTENSLIKKNVLNIKSLKIKNENTKAFCETCFLNFLTQEIEIYKLQINHSKYEIKIKKAKGNLNNLSCIKIESIKINNKQNNHVFLISQAKFNAKTNTIEASEGKLVNKKGEIVSSFKNLKLKL